MNHCGQRMTCYDSRESLKTIASVVRRYRCLKCNARIKTFEYNADIVKQLEKCRDVVNNITRNLDALKGLFDGQDISPIPPGGGLSDYESPDNWQEVVYRARTNGILD